MKKFFKSVLTVLLFLVISISTSMFIMSVVYNYNCKFLGVLFSFLPWIVFVWYYLVYLK